MIKVADASIGRDRTYKQELYADSGIPFYAIVVLSERIVEVYTQPVKRKRRYADIELVTGKQKITIATGSGRGLKVAASELLP